jgi:hypothetical protein
MEQTQINKPVFDSTKPFVVPILSGGEKRCEVRYPTDDEWCAWARSQRTVRRFLGRGKSQSEDLDLPKINADLFAIHYFRRYVSQILAFAGIIGQEHTKENCPFRRSSPDRSHSEYA